MSRKKIILLSGVAFLVITAILLTIFGGGEPSAPPTGTGNPTPAFPTPTTPRKTSPPINSDQLLVIDNPQDSDKIKDKYAEYVSKPPQKDFAWADMVDTNNNYVSVNAFFQATNSSLNTEMETLLDQHKFFLFSCPMEQGTPSLGIVLNIKLMPDYQGNLYSDEVKFMRAWENTLFQDTRNIIFPSIQFTPEQLNQKLTFKNGKYRFAEVTLPNNKKGSLNYSIQDDYIIITNSLPCLAQSANSLLPQE